MKLEKLIFELEVDELEGDLETNIAGIAYDSREVKEGYLFVAISGFETDGHKYIMDAIDNGASAILVEKDVNISQVPVIKISDTRSGLAKVSAKFYDYPAQDLTVVGVTGTNGKTTTTYLIEGILNNLGLNTGLVGTIKNKVGATEKSADRTTPESLDLQQMFAQMLNEGVTHVVMEASSHALALDRVLEIDFDRKVFTNLSRDHLDFHKNFEQYLAAKLKLFKSNNKPSIINVDDSRSEKIIEEVEGDVITYSIDEQSDFEGKDINVGAKGVSYRLETANSKEKMNLNLTGKFNVYNSLAAIATVCSMGYDLMEVKSSLEKICGVPGRFEIIDEGQECGVIVDYAHTPDGMKNVLKTAQEFTTGDVIVVFGCGGDRDRKKRPMMGKLGVRLADYAIVTSDNPRSEDPEEIISDIRAGIDELDKDSDEDYTVIKERGQAIKNAINKANQDDLVIIIGKGHETYQDFGDRVIEFDDRKVAREAINGVTTKN